MTTNPDEPVASRLPTAWFWIPLPTVLDLPDDVTIHLGTDDISAVAEASEAKVAVDLARFRGLLHVRHLSGQGNVDVRVLALARQLAMDLNRPLPDPTPLQPSDMTVLAIAVPMGPAIPGRVPTEGEIERYRTSEVLTEALDAAIEVARRAQHAWNLGLHANEPLIRRGHLPFALPYVLGWYLDDGSRTGLDDPPALLPYNAAALPQIRHQPEPETWGTFTTAFDGIHDGQPLYGYARLRNQARSLWEHDGDRSLAVIVANTAVEVLLDEVLGMLLWEERVLPDVAAMEFGHADAWSRMKPRLEPRLGNGWDPKTQPASQYWQKLALLRNHLVHAGTTPTRGETIDALEVLTNIYRGLIWSITRDESLARYPLTALAVCGGADGLKQVGRLKRRVRERIKAVGHLDWAAIYRRWEWHTHRQRAPQRDDPGTHPDYHDLVAIAHADGTITHWVYDRWTRHAAPTGLKANLAWQALARAAQMAGGDIQALVDTDQRPTPTGPWRPDYEVLPNHFIFVDNAPMFPVD